MGKKDTRTPQQRRADRARLREWTQEQGIELKTFEDVQELFKDFVAMTLEGGLEAELEEELGYSRYDYRNNRTGAQSIPNRRYFSQTEFPDSRIPPPCQG